MKKQAEKMYEVFLLDVQAILGDQVTYSNTLNNLCSYLFGSLFQGVFARDTLPPNVRYAIVNLDRSSESGSHWCAVADGMIYDSFGRDVGFGLKMTDPDAEQDLLEVNCGQRCIAFLCVYHVLGVKYAKHI
jgi:hypothetical protein